MASPFILEIPLISKANRSVSSLSWSISVMGPDFLRQHRLHSEQSGCQWEMCVKTQKALDPKTLLGQAQAAWPVTHILVTETPFFSCGITTVFLAASLLCSAWWTPPATAMYSWISFSSLFLLGTPDASQESVGTALRTAVGVSFPQ